jgi:hypothetical protein
MRYVTLFPSVLIAWASLGFAQSAPQPLSPQHGWQPSQQTNVPDAYTYTRFTLAGKFPTPTQAEASVRPALVVDCIPGTGSDHPKGRFLAAHLLVGTPLQIRWVEVAIPENANGIWYPPKVAVQYRADDAHPERDQWPAGTDKTSASIPKGALKEILRAHTVAITAADADGSRLPMQFDMSDAAPVKDGCNLDER